MMNSPETSTRTVGRTLFRFFGMIALLYAGFVFLLAGCQRRLVYFPAKGSAEYLRSQAAASGWAEWKGADGTAHGWKGKTAAAGQTPSHRLVAFHGNAGYALHRSYLRNGFAQVGDGRVWEVYVFEYPGYGARAGSPGEAAFVEAADAALKDLFAEDERPVVLLGESIGSGVACALAERYPDRVAGLFLITPFTSLPDVGARHYPLLPVRWILRDRYDNTEALRHYEGPVAILSAGRDEIISPEFARRLHDGYQGRKRIWTQPQARHNTLDYSLHSPWWEEVSDFLLE